MDEPTLTTCPGCGVELPATGWTGGNPKYQASAECQEVAGALLGYETEHLVELGHLHQLRIDAYGAQHTGEHSPAIGTVFALNGLYMSIERGSTGLEVRTAHGIMANSGASWPKLRPPAEVGELTAFAVLQGGSVPAVEKLMVRWAEQVWAAWPEDDREVIRRLTIDLVPARYLRR